jgi:hypothetical protein
LAQGYPCFVSIRGRLLALSSLQDNRESTPAACLFAKIEAEFRFR